MPSPTTDLVRSYLKEIGRYPLLTPEQEITNARLVQQMMAIEEQRSSLALQLNRQPTARELATSLGQSEAEVELILHQGERAKQKMVTANLRLVVAIAKKYQNRNLEFLENIKELLASLAPIQREVLTLRFGLENDHQLSLTQIGERLNLSRERIRQLEHKALSILRRQKSDILEYLN
ncbi:sigma factor-like helix-turn-helix DNA-binding protein [uncultured Nostoc sp.]|uniref:sigma factor-like helix-turn-helix DNA-binding protein n=1 Tax=uncultured Nostoc sp. TaxID=340711 RepID=UPI0035C989CE